MPEATSGAVAPSAPAGVQPSATPQGVAPPSAQQGPKRMRLSDMEIGLEQSNARADTRADETERRLARPDPQQAQPELGALPEPESDLLPPDDPQAPEAQQAQLQQQDQQLLDETKAWLAGEGEMPEAFKNQVHEWTNAHGVVRRATVKELQEGELRQSEFSNRMQQIRGYEQQLQFREQAANQLEQTFRDPDQLYEQIQRRDPAVLHKVAVKYSNQRGKMKQVAEAAGYALMQQYGYQSNHPDVVNAVRQTMQAQEQALRTDIENRTLREHNQMLAQQRQRQDNQAAQQQRMQQMGNSLAQLIPSAFQSVGVRNRPDNVEAFYRCLNSYVANLPQWDGNVRRQHCVEAAKMVREEIEDRDARARPKQQPPQSRAMSPSKLSSSGSSQPTTPDRKRVSDMQNDGRFGFG